MEEIEYLTKHKLYGDKQPWDYKEHAELKKAREDQANLRLTYSRLILDFTVYDN